jgi:hypothetical protein
VSGTSNKSAAGKRGIRALFHAGRIAPALPERNRWANRMSQELASTRSWEQIVARYEDLLRHGVPLEPMVELVRRLAASPAAPELERNTSMNTLLISNAPAKGWRENVLRITFHSQLQEFEFEYSHYDGDTNVTQKRCPVAEGWDMLSRFVRYKFGVLLPDEPKS